MPAIIGHRGAMAVAPENTLASFERALADGADGLECDVHLTRDGHVVVLHDFTLDRTTTGSGAVGDRCLSELKGLDAGGWFDPRFAGEPVPTLDQFLAVLARHRAGRATPPTAVIEIKAGSMRYPGLEQGVLDALRRADMLAYALVISFDHLAIQLLSQLSPELETGVLYFARPVDAASLARAAGARWICPSVDWVDADTVARAHRAGLKVFAWTARTPELARDLCAWGLDAFGANDPGALRAELAV